MAHDLQNYFPTFSEALDAVQTRLNLSAIELVFGTVNTPPDEHWTVQVSRMGPVAYGQTLSANFEILTLKGKPTRKWYHIVIYRMDNGSYELVTYIL